MASSDWSAFGGAPGSAATTSPVLPAPSSQDGSGWDVFGGRAPVKQPEAKPPSVDMSPSDVADIPGGGALVSSDPGTVAGARQQWVPFTASAPSSASTGQQVVNAVGRVGSAVAEGFAAPPFMTPEAEAAANQARDSTWVGRNISYPAIELGRLPFRALNALGAGIGQLAYESGNLVDPRLGRDFYMLNQLAPAAAIPEISAPIRTQALRAEYGPPTLERLTQAVQDADKPEPSIPPQATPQSVGSAASREGTPAHMLTVTPAQEQAYRSTAEGNKLLETQQPGIPDQRQLVTGVQPNSVELEQSVQAARELKSLKLASPQLGEDQAAIVDANNSARQGFFNNLAGSKVTLQNAIDARQAQADADLKTTWANKADTDPQAVLDTAQQILQSPDGRRQAVRNAVNSVTRELYDANGNLITDPEMLYGVRKHIGDMLSSEGAATDPLAVRAKANLLELQNSLDGVISAGAPNFRTYLDNFSTASRPIDAMRVLQEHENGLYGTQNRMEYGRFQRFMRDVVDARSQPGVNSYKSIPDDTMQQLWNLRDDLRRSSAAVELARTAGSDTAQNLMDLAKHGLARGVGATLGATAGSLLGPIGTGVGASVGAQAGEGFMAGRAEQRAYRRGQQLLYPQNQLGPP